jgi:chromosome segregation ATPase
MITKSKLPDLAWKTITKFLGKSPELSKTESDLELIEQELKSHQQESKKNIRQIQTDLEQARNDKLQWMAKESTIRKDLQDSQERIKDLLEQVVRLTHQQRKAKQSILDQKFKMEATPLERTRHEIELAQARETEKKAIEKSKRAEEQLARFKQVEKEAKKVKGLETKLAWEKKQSQSYYQALQATVQKLKAVETSLARLKASRAKIAARRAYKKPHIRKLKTNPIPA